MSGGIDSSAVCIMLQEQGYEVVGVTMRTWDVPSHFSTPGQEQPDEVLEAQKKYDEAISIYQQVKDEYVQSAIQQEIDKYIERATVSK